MQLHIFEKISYSKEKLIVQKFELRRLGPPSRICTPVTGCFHGKTIISNEIILLDCHLQLKNCRRQCTLLPRIWAKSLTKFNPKMQDFKHVFGLKLQAKGKPHNLFFSIGFQTLQM